MPLVRPNVGLVNAWRSGTIPSPGAGNSLGQCSGMGYHWVTPYGTKRVLLTTDGLTWAENTASANGGYVIAYGNGLFSLGDATTASSFSTDGATWTTVSLPGALAWRGAAYGGGVWVAVAAGSTTAGYSTDGLTWTAKSMPTIRNWAGIAYGNNVWAALQTSANTAAASSTDGQTWTLRTSASSAYFGTGSLAFGNGTFVAVGGNSTNNSTVAMTSSDAITWTLRTLPTGGNWSVTFGNGIFLASYLAACAVSTDGVTWVQRTAPTSGGHTFSYTNGLFISAVNSTTASDIVHPGTAGSTPNALASINRASSW